MKSTRRAFLGTTTAALGAAAIGAATLGRPLPALGQAAAPKRDFKISLAAWSLHKAVGSKEMPMLDMPRMAREDFGIEALELVNRMLDNFQESFEGQKPHLDKLAKNAADQKVALLLIMVDGEGAIGSRDARTRDTAIANHSKWVDIAAYLGGHSIRMNWVGLPPGAENDPEAVKAFIERSAPAFRKLCDYAGGKNISVLIENHGGASSQPETLKTLMDTVKHERFGTLPDFGNYPDSVDRYAAIDMLMPYAKAVSAKCTEFDDATGNEATMDYERILGIVVDKHGYHGHIGIEYEGDRLSEPEGIKACKKLLDRLHG